MEIPFELVAAKRFVELGVLALPGVTGISLGMREEDGELFDELAVRILVEDADAVPEGLPDEVAGVPICIIESDVQACAFPDTDRYPDVRGGIMITQPLVGGGTLGALVEDTTTGEILGLSCQHVVGNTGQPAPTVWQPDNPPLVHGSTPNPANLLGEVRRSDFPQTPPLPFSPVRVGLSDAAVFTLDAAHQAGRASSRAIAGNDPASPNLVDAITATAQPEISPVNGLNRVRKRGFATGPQTGTVIAQHASLRWKPGGPNVYLIDQWEINGDAVFARDGDSGSVVLQENSPVALGLLWGNNGATQFMPEGKRGYMTDIGTVESRLGVSVVWA